MPADRFLHQKAGHSQKVNILTDLEYRVWTQYLLSADDFGVMRCAAVKLQSDNDHLSNRPVKMITRCLDALIKIRLVRGFDHQGARYIYQHDWQDFQKVTWPARTINPTLPAEALSDCTPATQLLFSVHPGARKVPGKNFGSTSEELPKNSEITPEELSPTRARVPAKGLMANGSGLMAHGSDARETDERLDVAFAAFQHAYPGPRRKGGPLVEQTYLRAVSVAGGASRLLAALENHAASEQWSNPRMIPGMDVWLAEERWRQELPAAGAATASANNPKTAGNVPAFQRFIDRGRTA